MQDVLLYICLKIKIAYMVHQSLGVGKFYTKVGVKLYTSTSKYKRSPGHISQKSLYCHTF